MRSEEGGGRGRDDEVGERRGRGEKMPTGNRDASTWPRAETIWPRKLFQGTRAVLGLGMCFSKGIRRVTQSEVGLT